MPAIIAKSTAAARSAPITVVAGTPVSLSLILDPGDTTTTVDVLVQQGATETKMAQLSAATLDGRMFSLVADGVYVVDKAAGFDAGVWTP